MLRRLYISNFALIQEMDVTFPGKLSVITGETGAGKSIFLEALGLALGKRADASTLHNKTKKCIIEAEFDVQNLHLDELFVEHDIEPAKELILRREISAEGKSRSFLNDSVVSLSALKQLSEYLIDIHSQHQTLLLNTGGFQLELLDAFAGNQALLKEYKQVYKHLLDARKQLSALQTQENEARKQLDFQNFLFEELESAAVNTGELTALEQESVLLENAEQIQSLLLNASGMLQEGENNLLSQLQKVKQGVHDAARFNGKYKELADRINSSYVELKELAKDIASEGSAVEGNNERLQLVNERMDKINHLLRKHNVRDTEELLQIQQELSEKLQGFSSLEQAINKLQKEQAELHKTVERLAHELHQNRTKSKAGLEKEVTELLQNLSMESANFKLDLQSLTEPGPSGTDTLRFLFSANKGMPLDDMSKIASGGELSRVMLSLKAIMADKKQLPTIIFDEIDTGVSGDVANKIGEILQKMSKALQVITITHLPQMASKGQHHLFVYKVEGGDKTVSHIRALNKDERILEIAKMLSTSNPTASALKNAKDLLKL